MRNLTERIADAGAEIRSLQRDAEYYDRLSRASKLFARFFAFTGNTLYPTTKERHILELQDMDFWGNLKTQLGIWYNVDENNVFAPINKTPRVVLPEFADDLKNVMSHRGYRRQDEAWACRAEDEELDAFDFSRARVELSYYSRRHPEDKARHGYLNLLVYEEGSVEPTFGAGFAHHDVVHIDDMEQMLLLALPGAIEDAAYEASPLTQSPYGHPYDTEGIFM